MKHHATSNHKFNKASEHETSMQLSLKDFWLNVERIGAERMKVEFNEF